jgi:Eukaryotic glutathione synthase, ATP binding domain
MREILQKKENIERFLLMEKIDAPVLQTYMIRKGKISYTPSITELGIFSFLISNAITGEIILNEVDGLLPRTKQADCEEGGVNAGFAVIDHLMLIDDEVKDLKPLVQELAFVCSK